MAFVLGVAAPAGQSRPDGPNEFPLAAVWAALTTRPAWSFADPQTPAQKRGGQVDGPRSTPTKNGAKNGRAGAVAGDAVLPKIPDVPEQTLKAKVGFQPGVSMRVAAAATRTSDVYENADGSFTRKIHSEPVNYRAADGSWQPIDTNLRRGADGRLETTAGDVRVSLAGSRTSGAAQRAAADFSTAETSTALASVVFPTGEAISFGLQGAAAVEPVTTGSTAIYRNILAQTDIELITLAVGVKETIVLKSASAATEWVFALQTQGLTLRLEPAGGVSMLGADGAVVAVIPAGFMEDSRNDGSGDGASSNAVRYELTTVDGKQAFKVIADAAWIHDPARVFPIKVDPTLTQSVNASTYVQSPFTNNNSSTTELKAGYHSSGPYNARSFVRFDNFSSTYFGYRITAAKLKVHVFWAGSCPSTPNSEISVNDISSAWTTSGVTNWSNQPALGAAAGTVLMAPNATVCGNSGRNPGIGQWWPIDLTAAGLATVNRWTSGGANNGLALSAPLNSNNDWKQISSANTAQRPVLEVTYTDDEAPVLHSQYPPHGYGAPTLTPELLATATDPDSWPKALTYKFEVFDASMVKVVDSGTTPIATPNWTVPAGKLEWGKTYLWNVWALDGAKSAPPRVQAFTTQVPQPLITSGLALNPSSHGFEPRVGNYTMEVTDANVASPGPALAIRRSYNSRDPRRGQAFGAGWSTVLDSRVTKVGSTMVITYPSGQDIAFGLNSDGSTYSSPSGGLASSLKPTMNGQTITGYVLKDNGATTYNFGQSLAGGGFALSTLTDALGRVLTLTYDGAGKVTDLIGASGRRLTLTWTGSQVTAVTTDAVTLPNTKTIWRYQYSGAQLQKVCPPTVDAPDTTHCTSYEYQENSLYPTAILDAGPHTYLRLNDAGGLTAASSAVDSIDSAVGKYAGVAASAGPQLAGTQAKSAVFNGTSSLVELSKTAAISALSQSISLRFKVNPGQSGVLFARSTTALAQTGGSFNPVLYVGTDHQLYGELSQGTFTPITNGAPLTDGWHDVVLTADGNTQTLYLDGSPKGTLPGSLVAESYAYTYLGAGKWSGGWPQTTGAVGYFGGQISDFALYTRVLTPAQIALIHSLADPAAQLLTKVTTPQGRVHAQVGYNDQDGVVKTVTDSNGGTWKVQAQTRAESGEVYRSNVLAAAPLDYFRLADTTNQVHGGEAVFQATAGVDNGPFGESLDVMSFNGTSQYIKLPAGDRPKPTGGPQSVSMWFRAPAGSTTGGVLYSYQVTELGQPNTLGWTPALYIGTDGKLRGEFWTGAVAPITSDAAVNDGHWHHVALSASGTEQRLYLDGTQVGLPLAGNTAAADPQVAYLGAGKWTGWPSNSAAEIGYFKGDLAEFAYFNSGLDSQQVWKQFSSRDVSRSYRELIKAEIVTTGPNTVSLWFNLPNGSTSGGVLYSYQAGPITDESPGGWNPALYVDTDGYLRGEFWTGGVNQIVSPGKVNDGNWHYVVLAAGTNSQKLYVDGSDVGTKSGAISANGVNYAYLGTGRWQDWPKTAGKVGMWPGELSDFRFETVELSAAQIGANYAAGRTLGELTLSAPAGTPTKRVKVIDPGDLKGVTNVYDLAAGGRQIELINAADERTSFGYDAGGFLRTVTDPIGNVTTTEHDGRGNVSAETKCRDYAAGDCNTSQLKYFLNAIDPADLRNDKLIESRDQLGNVTTYAYDLKGNLVEITDPLGRKKRVEYTSGTMVVADFGGLTADNVRYVRVAATKRGTAWGYALSEFEVFGAGSTNVAQGRPATATSEYDPNWAAGRATDGSMTTSWSSLYTDLQSITVDLGAPQPVRRVRLNWDVAYGETYQVEASTNGTSWTTLATVADQDGTAEVAGLPTRLTSAGGSVQRTNYATNGDITDTADAIGLQTSFTYDGLGRIAEQRVGNDLTKVDYDRLGRVKVLTEPMAVNRVTGAQHTKVTTNVYDWDGLLTSTAFSDSTGGDAARTVTSEYNNFGQKVKQSDAKNNMTLLEYDAYGRVFKQTTPDGTVTVTDFDEVGRQWRTKVNGQTTETESYDGNGRLVRIIDELGFWTNFDYTDDNLVKTKVRVDPSTPGTSYTVESNVYDKAGHLTTRFANNLVTKTTFGVDAAGRVEWETVDPGPGHLNRTVTRTYGADDTALSTTLAGPDGSQTVDALYDAAGRQIWQGTRIPGLTGGPDSWWQLNEIAGVSANDEAAANRDGTLWGPVSWSEGGAKFTGAGDIYTQGPVVDTGQSFAISTWAKVPPGAPGGTMVSQDGNVRSGFEIYNGGHWDAVKPFSDGNYGGCWLDSGVTPTPDKWTHLVLVFDTAAGNKLSLYVDGQLKATADSCGASFQATGNFEIGRAKYASQSSGRFTGGIDNVQAYRRALGTQDVATLFATGRAGNALGGNAITTSWARDLRGQTTSETDPNGNVTGYEYDAAGRLVQTSTPTVTTEKNSVVSSSPIVSLVGFDTFGGVVDTKDADNRQVLYERNANGQVIKTTSPSYTAPGSSTAVAQVAETFYDTMGRVEHISDASGVLTYYTYDEFGQVRSVRTMPDNKTMFYTYHLDGSLASTTDRNAAVSQETYDYLGRPFTSTQILRVAGQPSTPLVSKSNYDTQGGWLTSVETPEVTRKSPVAVYNAVGEVVSATDFFGNSTAYTYDFAGRRTVVDLPDHSKQKTVYDAAGRAESQQVLSPAGATLSTASVTYDPKGQVLTAKDPVGTVSTYTYNPLGWITQATQPVSATETITTSFGYDTAGNQTRYTNGRGATFRATYNKWNLPEDQIEPDGATFTTVYDSAGRTAQTRSPGGVTASYSYDPMGNLERVVGAGAEVSTSDRVYTYDAMGQVLSLSGPGGTNTLAYDDRGLLTSVTGPSGNSSFGYTLDGLVSSRTDAAGTTTFGYDESARLKTVANSTAGMNLAYYYNPLSQVSKITYGSNQNRRVFGYDGLQRLKTDELKSSSGPVLASVTYDWDLNGNMKSKATSGIGGSTTNTYGYDQANRLTSWNNGTAVVPYAYDRAGNRTQAGAKTFTYTTSDRLSTASDGTAYEYTARGTLKKTTTGSVALDTVSDAFGQAVKQYSSATQFSQYDYDGLGRLIRSGFAYTGTGNDLAKDPTADYVRDPNGALVGVRNGGSSTYAWTDLHTDVIGQFTAAGASLSGSTTYEPFGKVTASAGMQGSLGYQSGWTDTQTKRVNMHARWYNTDTGQFDSRDTFNVANRFNYADNNPLVNTDPTGHMMNWQDDQGSRDLSRDTSWGAWQKSRKAARDAARTAAEEDKARHNKAQLIAALPDCAKQGKKVRGQMIEARGETCTGQIKKCATPRGSRYDRQSVHQLQYCTTVEIEADGSATFNGTVTLSSEEMGDLSPILVAGVIDNYARQLGGYMPAGQAGDKAHITYISLGAALEGAAAEQHEIDRKHDEAKCEADWSCRNKLAGTITGIAAAIVAPVTGCDVLSEVGAYSAASTCQVATTVVLSVAAAVGCGMISGGTLAVACAIGAAGLINVYSDSTQGNIHSWSDAAVSFAIGGAAAAVTGGMGMAAGSMLRTAGTLARITGGALAGGAAAAVGEYMTTGHISLQNVLIGAAFGALGGKLGGACKHSFDPSTKVLTATGAAVAIADLKVGDMVVATDPATGETTDQPITALHLNLDTDLTDVEVAATLADRDSDRGPTATLKTTAHHPFWDATSSSWVNAADLVPGESTLTGPDGQIQRVVSVHIYPDSRLMHDLTVATVHTYYVLAGTTPVLVHNCGDTAKHSPGNLANSLDDNVFFHYTDDAGHAAIMDGGVVRANSKGVSYFTQDMVKSGDANSVLFAGNPSYAGRGSQVIAFRISPDRLRGGVQPNELVHDGSFRFTLDDVIFHGANPFG